MALHITTDSELEGARPRGFEFGALADLMRPEDDSASIARELKEMDDDHDLD